jgi:Tfp pilus assembly protein PilX
MTRLLRSERGSAVVTAIMVMSAMITIGLASYAVVDTQTKLSAGERTRESNFDYGEGVLNAEAYITSTYWPGSAAPGLPDCTFNGTTVTASGASTDATQCPTAATLQAAFSGADYSKGVTWTSKIRDNVGTDACQFGSGGNTCGYYYSDSAINQPYTVVKPYDANGDGMVWLRSRSVIGTNARTQVAMIQVQKQSLTMPHAVLTANTVTSNYSPKLKVFPGTSNVLVRCASAQAGNPQGCINTKSSSQIPTGSVKSTSSSSALSAADLQKLRERAKSENSWYATCPSSPPGPFVFIESGNCGASSLPPSSAASPGLYVLVDGTLNISGSGDYWGLIYLVNKSNLTGNVFDSNGLHKWHGAINIDGNGNANLGTSSNTSLTFDDNVFAGLYAYVNAGIVRPSYREVQSSQP